MKITAIEATTHRVSLKAPLLEEPLTPAFVFVRVETDAGLTGYGLTGPIQRAGTRELINRQIAPVLKGRDPVDTERHWHDLFYGLNPRAQTGVWSSAVSAVDIALWDLKGKRLGLPVWRLLGSYSATVPAYVTFGLLEYSREQLVEAARRFADEGHDKLKLVVAIHDGKDPASPGLKSRSTATTRGCSPTSAGRRVSPSPPARTRATSGAIASCSFTRPWTSCSRTSSGWGGYTEAVKVAAMAPAYNVPIANGGGWPHHNMHLIAGVANGWRVEFHLVMWLLGEQIFQDPPKAVRGAVTLSEQPGLGLEPKLDVLKESREP